VALIWLFHQWYNSELWGGAVFHLPGMSEAMDGRSQAHMGEASVYEAELHAKPNDSNL